MISNARPRRNTSCLTGRTPPTTTVVDPICPGAFTSRCVWSSSVLSLVAGTLTWAWLSFDSRCLRSKRILINTEPRRCRVHTTSLTCIFHLDRLFSLFDLDSCSHKSLIRDIQVVKVKYFIAVISLAMTQQGIK